MRITTYDLRTGDHTYTLHDDDGQAVYSYAWQDGPGPTQWMYVRCRWVDGQVRRSHRECSREEHLRVQALPVWREEVAR